MAQRDPKRRRTALGTALASIHDALVGSREAEQNAVRVAEAMELLGLDDAPPSPAAAAVAAAAAAVDAVDDAGAAATAFADALVTSNAARGMEVGHAAVRRVRWALSNLGIKFTDQQTTFHDMMLYATLPHLFGAEWDANEAEILAYYGRARHSPRVAMSMPRSGGKTMAVTAFLASFMWAMVDSGLSIVCFSIQQDQARWVLESTLTLLSRLPGGEAMCHRKGVDLFVSHKSRDMASTTAIKLRAQSGNAAGGRGLQPDILLLEEAAFIDPELYFQTIFPMFAHARRSVIAISSPSDAGGVFSSLFSLRFESGDLIFDTVKDQNICDDCLLAKRMRCDHKIAVLPPWKTERQKELLRLMVRCDPGRTVCVCALRTARACARALCSMQTTPSDSQRRSRVRWGPRMRPCLRPCWSTRCSPRPSARPRRSRSCSSASTPRRAAPVPIPPGRRSSSITATRPW